MSTDAQLESYLATLDKALGPIPVSSRAEIVTEIKNHVLETQQRDPNSSLGTILAALGEPEAVANRYLMERGLKPGRAPRTPIIKWLTIGFLGTMGLICLTFVFVIWRFTPLIAIDEKSDHIILLGGVIDVDGKAGRVKIGSFEVTDDDDDEDHSSSAKKMVGSEELDASAIHAVRIPFENGKIELETSRDNRVHWSCKLNVKGESARPHIEASVYSFDFGNNPNIRCEFQVPANVKALLEGKNAKLSIERPLGDVDVTLHNGKVSVEPDPETKYHYDLDVQHGMVGEFDSSNDPKAFEIKIHLSNGVISKAD